jgi:hypothetical protein
LQESLAQRREIDVEHHHDEQEQHRHGADIDHDKQQRQEFGPGQHEQSRSIDEGQNKKQHGVNRVTRRDHHQGRSHEDRRE